MPPDHSELLHDLLRNQGIIQGELSTTRTRLGEFNQWISKLEDRQRQLEIRVAVFGAGGGAIGMLAAQTLENMMPFGQ